MFSMLWLKNLTEFETREPEDQQYRLMSRFLVIQIMVNLGAVL